MDEACISTGLNAISQEQKDQFEKEGFLIIKGVFTKQEITEIDQTFMKMSKEAIPGCFEPIMDQSSGDEDPLKRYPRMMHPHRVNDLASSSPSSNYFVINSI